MTFPTPTTLQIAEFPQDSRQARTCAKRRALFGLGMECAATRQHGGQVLLYMPCSWCPARKITGNAVADLPWTQGRQPRGPIGSMPLRCPVRKTKVDRSALGGAARK